MLVEVLKENYLIVLSENKKDDQWLDRVGYQKLGDGYFQEIFDNIDELVEEVNYLIDYGAEFDQTSDENSPYEILESLKEEGFID